MAMTLKDIREKYPDYNDMSDTQLADALHKKYYSDLPKEKVYETLGVNATQNETPEGTAQPETPQGAPGAQEPAKPPPSFGQSLKEVSADAIDLLKNSLRAVKKGFVNAPGNLEKSGEDILKHPVAGRLHVLGQLGAGTAELVKGTINAPHDFAEYLSKKNIPGLSAVENAHVPFTKDWKLKDLIPHIPEDTGVEKALGLEAQPEKGDNLIRAIPEILSLGAGGVSVIKAFSKALSKPSKDKLAMRAIEDKIDTFAEKHNLDQKETEALKNSLAEEYSKLHGEGVGELTPSGQKVAINKKKLKIAEKEPLTKIPEKEVGEIPPPPDTQAIIEEHKANTDKAREQVESSLGVLDNPGLKSGPVVHRAIKTLKKGASDLYNAAKKHYVDKNVKANNTHEIQKATAELDKLKDTDELAPGYGSGTDSQVKLAEHIKSLEGETVAASDIYSMYRSLQKMANNARDKQFASGTTLTDIQREGYGKLAEKLDKFADVYAKRLESVGGEEIQSMIKQANIGWRTYSELKQNPIGRTALKTKFLPSNALVEIAKGTSGNEFLKALIANNPDLKRNVLAAYVGETSVNKLTKPNSLVEMYLNDPALHDVQDALGALKTVLTTGKKETTAKVAEVQKKYDDFVESVKNTAKEQKMRQDAIKETEELKKQVKFHEAAIPKLQKRIDIGEANGTSTAALEKEKKQHQRDMQDKKGKIKKIAGFILRVKGVQGITNKLHL